MKKSLTIKKSLIIYLFPVLLKLNLMHVIASTLSYVAVTQKKSYNLFSTVTYSAHEKIFPVDEQKKALQNNYIESLYSPIFLIKNNFAKKFKHLGGSFYTKISVYLNNRSSCGHLTVFRHTQNESDLTYIFTPSPDAKTNAACQKSGFHLAYGNSNNPESYASFFFSTHSEEKQSISIDKDRHLFCVISVF